MKKLLSTIAILASFSAPAFAEDITIEMLNKRDDGAKMVYSEDIARIGVGDTITWLPKSKGHNVHFIAGPEGWDFLKSQRTTKKFQSHLIHQEYICTNVHHMLLWE